MAEITNGRTGAAYLAVGIEILRKEMEQGTIRRKTVLMNSDLGLLWTRVSYQVGEKEIFAQEVLLHSISISSWDSRIAAMNPDISERIPFAIESPELYIEVKHYGRTDDAKPDDPIYQNPSCQFLIYVDTAIAAGSFGISMSGPAMVLLIPMSEIQNFAHALHQEADAVLQAAPPLIDGSVRQIEG
jgi:hypothetical protein